MAGKDDSGMDLTCPVCLETFTSPRFLPCHHTLCTECISDLMERVAPLDHFLCPMCQVQIKVPEDGVTSFQVNFYLVPLLAGKARVSRTSSAQGSQPCQQCASGNGSGGGGGDANSSASSVSSFASSSSSPSSSSSAAVAQCQQCHVALCRPCIDRHLLVPANTKHSFAPLEAPKTAANRISASVNKTPESSPSSSFDLSCDAHWSGAGEMMYYCTVCTCLVCRLGCAQHQGQDHSVVDVAQEAQNHRSEVRRQLLSLRTFQGALADLEDDCKHRVTALEGSCQQVADKMNATCQQACAKITARARKSGDKVTSLKGRIGKVVDGEKKSIQEKMATLSSLLMSAGDVLAASDSEFLRKKTKLMARIQSVMSKVPPSRGNLHFSFKMSPDIQSLVTKDSSFGYMTVQFRSPVLRHRMTLSSTKQERKLRKLYPRADGSMMACVGNCLVYISSEFAETKRLEFPAEIVDFLPQGESIVYVVLSFPHAVKELNTTTDVARDFLTPLNPPLALAFSHKQELVFASNDGKELSLTFYSTGGVRLKRLTIPKPDFTPSSAVFTKRGQLFLSSTSEILCLDSDFSDLASLTDLRDLRPRCLSGLRGMGSGVGDVLVANWAAGNVEVVDLCDKQLTRRRDLIEWKRGTTEEDADLSKGLVPNISCAVVDPAGKLWVGQEDGQVSVYDWLLRAS